MRKLRTFPLVVSLLLILSGCAHTAGPVSDENKRSAKRVAVVSDLGSRAYSISLGVISFANRLSGRDVPEWNVDNLVSGIATQALASNGFDRLESIHLPAIGPGESSFNRRELAIAEAERRGFDTVVYIYQGSLVYVPFYVPGYGVFQHVGHEDKIIERCHYAAYSISVTRVSTKTQIGWDRAYRFPCANRDEPDLTVKRRVDDYSQQELGLMKAGVQREIEASLMPALRKLNLAR